MCAQTLNNQYICVMSFLYLLFPLYDFLFFSIWVKYILVVYTNLSYFLYRFRLTVLLLFCAILFCHLITVFVVKLFQIKWSNIMSRQWNELKQFPYRINRKKKFAWWNWKKKKTDTPKQIKEKKTRNNCWKVDEWRKKNDRI